MHHRQLIWLASAWQFIFMVDFVAPLPLGPTLSQALGFEAQQVAWLSVSYTFASMCAGLLAARLLRKTGRAPLLVVCLALFAAVNLLTPWARSLPELALYRALAGLLGAPVVATLMAIVIDVAPVAQRGKAISHVMSGASLAVVLGVPAALMLTNFLGWRAVFWALGLATTGLLINLISQTTLLTPSRDASAQAHPAASTPNQNPTSLLSSPDVHRACILQALSQFSTFLLIPVLATHVVGNLGISLTQLPMLYMLGGIASFACMRWSGRASDQYGFARPLHVACIALLGAMFTLASPLGFVHTAFAAVAFVAFMAANAAKNVALSTYTAQLAPPKDRASFMSLQGSVQDLAILLAGLGPLGLLMPTAQPGQVAGMSTLIALAATALVALVAAVRMAQHPARSQSAN
ncbi:MFS transporter [Aquabacterium sp.]|uniref:MFS transporter n=1 Tax=Aquabacterium sp. TaxID=1872578 RepID=UPI004037CA4E